MATMLIWPELVMQILIWFLTIKAPLTCRGETCVYKQCHKCSTKCNITPSKVMDGETDEPRYKTTGTIASLPMLSAVPHEKQQT